MGKAQSRKEDDTQPVQVSKNVLLLAHVGDQVQRQFYVLKRQSPLYERVQALGTASADLPNLLLSMAPCDVVAIVDPDTKTDWVSVIGDGVVLHDHQVTHLLQIVDKHRYPCIRVTDRATERDKEIIDEVRDELLLNR